MSIMQCKKRIVTRNLFLLWMLWMPMLSMAQITLVKNHKAQARILLVEDNAVNKEAAELLNFFLQKMSGVTLPVSVGEKATSGSVLIGELTQEAGYEGFALDCSKGVLRIQTGGGFGAAYGVATLLERWLGVAYYAYEAYTFTPMQTVTIPQLHCAETPAFRFRQTFSYGNEDPKYVRWFRLNKQQDVFADNLWVHTFNRILPSSVYGKSHPEYYSFINGERRPGEHSQWCLSNPEVFELAAHKIDSIFRANPGKTMISVSQNDGNNTYCQCEACKKVDAYEGGPSGSIIRFLNKLAQQFPDKQFSTLAYLFSMHPPKHVKPLPNVNIMLCDIDCKREVPLTDNASGQDFVKAIEGWARISDNIFVWDYGINFDNMVAPFPNFHILQPNIQLFKKHHATMLFEQVNGGRQRGTDFGELRAYMLAKLMWNPYLNTDSLMKTFLNGYYGAAGPILYRYLQIQQGALLSSDIPLWIYDSPISHKTGMLNDRLIKVYDALFDEAEKAVAGNEELLGRVQTARLPLRYSKLEIARTRQGGDAQAIRHDLEIFRQHAERYGITSLNERNNLATDYCALYAKRFLPRANTNKAAGAKVIWKNAPAKRYQAIAENALTDGLYGGTTFVESWVGWEGEDADFVLDMGEAKTFSKITTDFLHQLGAWVLQPQSITCSWSADGETFQEIGTHTFADDRDVSVKFVPAVVSASTPVSARYVRIQVKGLGLCPSWHYGVGYPAWFFIDEVTVE